MKIGTVRPEEARVFDEYEGYHSFHSEETHEEYGSFEIFWSHGMDEESGLPAGWYWWACFPGCLPDGEPNGPFASSGQALRDADEWHPEFDGE
jgi:hypothetical protein